MTTEKFFIPTQDFILNLNVGDLAPDFSGTWREVIDTYKSTDIEGKWFVCYRVKLSENSSVSDSLKEGRLHRTVQLTGEFTSWELDKIEAQINKERL